MENGAARIGGETMIRYNETDLLFYDFSTIGDLCIHESGDFEITKSYESARQDIQNRIRTQTGDWRSHSKIGGNLELLIGEPNTRETGRQGMMQIFETLTYDNRFLSGDLEIKAIPIAIDQIDFYVFLKAGKTTELVIKEPFQL